MCKRSIALSFACFFITALLGCSRLLPKHPLTWHLTLELYPAGDPEAASKQTVSVIESRLNAIGVPSFRVTPETGKAGGARVVVNLSEVRDRERVKNILTNPGQFELNAVVSPPAPAPAQTYPNKESAITSLNSGSTIPPNRRILLYPHNDGTLRKDWVVVETPFIVDSVEVRNASVMPEGGSSDKYSVQFSLTKSGGEKLGEWTGMHTNRYLALVLNDQVMVVARVEGQMFDRGVIRGAFTQSAAEDLALVLRSGAYPAPVRFIEEGENK